MNHFSVFDGVTTYRIIRFKFKGGHRAVRGKNHLSLEAAQEYCSRHDTHAHGICHDCHYIQTNKQRDSGEKYCPTCNNYLERSWFDGYEEEK